VNAKEEIGKLIS